MSYCPVCNGLQQLEIPCPICQNIMNDKGRWMDYFDDYSAYLPIELTKENNEIKNDKLLKKCTHIVLCEECRLERILLIEERD